MNQPKVSVIIPVYGVEKYIERCARSLFEQTLDDIELIFINDCSPDRSMEILHRVMEEYPKRKEQTIIINHEKNQGIAFTRGEGIKSATGDYIGWCDSDDWCELDMFEALYQKAMGDNADIVVCSNFEEHPEGSVARSLGKNYNLDLKTYYTKGVQFVFLWRKIFRRSLLQGNDIYPTPGINVTEDLNICVRALFHAKRITQLNRPLYHYNRCNTHSITHSQERLYERWLQQKRNVEFLAKYISDRSNGEYTTTIDFLKFMNKNECLAFIPTFRERYEAFCESHKSIMKFTGLGSFTTRLKIRLLYSCYPIYYLLARKKSV